MIRPRRFFIRRESIHPAHLYKGGEERDHPRLNQNVEKPYRESRVLSREVDRHQGEIKHIQLKQSPLLKIEARYIL